MGRIRNPLTKANQSIRIIVEFNPMYVKKMKQVTRLLYLYLLTKAGMRTKEAETKDRPFFWRIAVGSCVLLVILLLGANWRVGRVAAKPLNQQPTVDVATVTSTQPSAIVTVGTESDQINVRSGPSQSYPLVGILIAGQQVPGLGRSPGGDWIQIAYAGVPGGVAWVYSPLVSFVGNLPIVEPPPTPTPLTTPTVDPVLAAEFRIDATATRLPTFTPPPPLDIPTFQPDNGSLIGASFPMGYLIISLAILGLFGILISILGRR